jgi:hypothetical protein
VSHEREGLSDAVTIPRMIKVFSEGFDPGGRLLLFCESANLRLWPRYGLGSIANLARNSSDKVTALLGRPLRDLPMRNTLTLLQLALIRYAVFEEWRSRVRGASAIWLNTVGD